MQDHSDGKYGRLTVVSTQEGYQVGRVGRRFTNQQVQVIQLLGSPSVRLADALASLDEVHAHDLELHRSGSLVALCSSRQGPRPV